jgi:hypothetical protein
VIVKRARKPKKNRPDGIGTILVSTEPFSDKTLNTIEKVAKEMKFEVVLSPRFAADSTFATLADADIFEEFTKNYPINIEPPTDDNPFYFQMLRFRNMFDREMWKQGEMTFNMKAIYVLGILLMTVIGLTFLCIVLPLILTTKKAALKGSFPFFLFFMSIGLGFMLIEISQMQRLIVFLGHPIYGLSVLLFALLLSSGIGSYSTQKMKNFGKRVFPMRLMVLLSMLVLFGLVTSRILGASQGLSTPMRICVAIGILFPIGFFMGMLFPMGMRLASERSAGLTPWLWGMNGATSVCASVLAVVIAISSRISTAFWTGFLCYLIAVVALGWILKKRKLSG